MNYPWGLRWWAHWRVRPGMVLAFALGAAVGGLLALWLAPSTAALLGWNLGLWLYLLLAWRLMRQADAHHVRRIAVAHAPGTAAVLAAVIAATAASVVAIVLELARAHGGWLPIALAAATLVGGWLLLPVVFTFAYASHYYRCEPPGGLRFPDDTPAFQPRYGDILYVAITISAAAQTSDVSLTTPPMRRLALLHTVVAFAFNATVLALSINIAAGLLSGH